MHRLWGTTAALVLALLILGPATQGALPAPDPPPLAVAPEPQPALGSSSSPAHQAAVVAREPVQTVAVPRSSPPSAGRTPVATPEHVQATLPVSAPTSPTTPATSEPTVTTGKASPRRKGAASAPQTAPVRRSQPKEPAPLSLPLLVPTATPAAAEEPLDRERLALAGVALALVALGGAVVLLAARRQLRELAP